MADEPQQPEEKEAKAAEPPVSSDPESREPKLSADMEAAKRFLAEHAAARAAMPQPVHDPMELRARWMRIAVLVSVLAVIVGVLWWQMRTKPVAPSIVVHAREAAAPRWAALSRCLVGAPLAGDELASSRMRRIFLALPRAAQRVATRDALPGDDAHEAWPGRCAASAQALTEALRPARDADRVLGDLAAVSIGVYVALRSGHVPASVDALFSAAADARLADTDVGAPDVGDAPPPLDLLDAAALELHALAGPNVHVVDVDDHRVLLRGERNVLCVLDDADARFACSTVPGDGGNLGGLRLVAGASGRALALRRDPVATASKIVDLVSGATVTEGVLAGGEARGDELLAVRGRPGSDEAFASAARTSLAFATPRGEVRMWDPAIAVATATTDGLVAWTTIAHGRETVLRAAGTGAIGAFAPAAVRSLSLGAEVPTDVTACADHGTRAVLVQLDDAPAPAALPPLQGRPAGPALLADAGLARPVMPDAALPPIDLHATPAHPYEPVPTDLPVERSVAVVLVAADGALTALHATIEGDAVLSCEEGAAVVTTLRSAADRTGASDDGGRAWRLREPGFLVTQLRCTPAGCAANDATLHGFRDVPEVRAQEGRVVAFFRAASSGGVRARTAPLGELGDVEDDVLADDQLHRGVDVREQRIGTGPRGALLVARTSAGVLAWRVGPDGAPRLLTGRR